MKYIKPLSFVVWFASIFLMSACSSRIPPEIREAPLGAPGVAQVRENTDAYLTQKVRWGGVILRTENKQNASWLTIVAFPLTDSGQPRLYDQSTGRFIAVSNDFLEPLTYSSAREITVTGTLVRTETSPVGEFPYAYPVIQVADYYLWPESPKVDPGYPPYWWYDPWYSPWYGPHHQWYPHYLRHHRHHH